MGQEKLFEEHADKIADVIKSKYKITEEEMVHIYALLEAFKYLHKKTGAIPNCRFLYGDEWTFTINKISNEWQVYFTERGIKEDITYHLDINSAINKLIKLYPFRYEGNQITTPEMIENDGKLLSTSYSANLTSYEMMLPVVYRFRHHINSKVQKLFNVYNGDIAKFMDITNSLNID